MFVKMWLIYLFKKYSALDVMIYKIQEIQTFAHLE